MNKMPWLFTLLIAGAMPALAAPESCERVKDQIAQKIINNGVPESGFTLEITPGDEAGRAGAQVVGHCANDAYQILYVRSRDDQ